MTHQVTQLPSRLNALTSAVLNVFSRHMSSGQLRKLVPSIKSAMFQAVEDLDVEERKKLIKLHTLQPISEWTDGVGPCLWWILPIAEPPYCGTPGDSDWPEYHTHWSRLPDCQMFVATDGTETQGK